MINSFKCQLKRIIRHFFPKRMPTYDIYNNISQVNQFYTEVDTVIVKQCNKNACSQINPPFPLFIPTYDGGNQSMHPKMLFFDQKWNGHKFWFVTTPYKGFNDFIENPCVYYSDNGIDFVPCANANPLNAITDDAKINYNSDPHLVYNSDLDRLECWWRLCKTDLCSDKGEYIFRKTTKDGIKWAEKECLFESHNSITGVVSPTVIFEDGIYKIWCSHSVNDDRQNRVISYFESKNGSDWQHIRDISIQSDKYCFSHFDLIHTKRGYEIVMQAIRKEDGSNAAGALEKIMYARSDDNISYSAPRTILNRGSGRQAWDNWRMYRPSITLVDSKYYLYYGATSLNYDWGTGLIICNDLQELANRIKE